VRLATRWFRSVAESRAAGIVPDFECLAVIAASRSLVQQAGISTAVHVDEQAMLPFAQRRLDDQSRMRRHRQTGDFDDVNEQE